MALQVTKPVNNQTVTVAKKPTNTPSVSVAKPVATPALSVVQPNATSLGQQAKAPEQNLTTTLPKLASSQVKTPSATPLNTSGLNEAYTRQQQGTANQADKDNLAYAQGRGWKPTTQTPQDKEETGTTTFT